MNLVRLGSEHWVDLDSVPDEGFVLSAGLGADVSFDLFLMKTRPNLQVIGIDPLPFNGSILPHRNFRFIQAALSDRDGFTLLYHGNRPDGTSIRPDKDRLSGKTEIVPTISLRRLRERYDFCLVKTDIEGGEFDLANQLIGVPQITMELHARCSVDVEDFLRTFTSNGYVNIKTHRREVCFLETKSV